MRGVINGFYQCNQERVDELNQRIYSRNVPSQPLQPNFDIQPVSTKYARLPILDRRAPVKTEIKPITTFDVTRNFNPGNAVGPWSGFSSKIDDESTLRSQFFALQSSDQSVYIPSTNSDLYKPSVEEKRDVSEPLIFKQEAYSKPQTPRCLYGMGGNIFNNDSRQQLKNYKGV